VFPSGTPPGGIYGPEIQSAGTVVVRMPRVERRTGGGVAVKGMVEVVVWRVVVARHLCSVWVLVEVVVVVKGASRDEQAV
jgi:hypothetical protein